jgi:hypothetical protein
MLFLFEYLFSLIFPDSNEYLDEYNFDSDSVSDSIYSDQEIDINTPEHFFMYG